MEGYVIEPEKAKATWVKNVHPATVIEGQGIVVNCFKLSNGDTLFYKANGSKAWTLVEGRRVEGQVFLAGGRTTPDEFKQKFSFGFVVE